MTTVQVRARAKSAWFKDLFFGNLTAKGMALIMALALWFYAYRASRYEADWSQPVEINASEGWSLMGEPPTVRLTVSYLRGLKEEFKAARAGKNRIRVVATVAPDAAGADEQTLTVDLDEGNFKAPAGLSLAIRSISPARIDVTMVREDSRPLPVELKLSAPPAGFKMETSWASPGKINVRGPKEILANAVAIETEEIDLGSLTPMHGVAMDYKLPARIVQYVRIGEEKHAVRCEGEVTAYVQLAPIPKEKTFSSIPIRLLIPHDYPYVAEAQEGERSTNVVVRGPGEIVDKLKPESIILYVDVSDVATLVPKDLRYTQAVHVSIIDTPRSNELTVKPAIASCGVKISKPPGK